MRLQGIIPSSDSYSRVNSRGKPTDTLLVKLLMFQILVAKTGQSFLVFTEEEILSLGISQRKIMLIFKDGFLLLKN